MRLQYGTDPVFFWYLAAEQSCWWYEDAGWEPRQEYHPPIEELPDDATAAATEAAAADAVPAEVHQIMTSALAASELYFTAARNAMRPTGKGRRLIYSRMQQPILPPLPSWQPTV